MLAFVTATSREMSAAVGGLGAPELGQGEVRVWRCSSRDMLLAVSGVGPVNAGIMAGRLAERNVSGIVNAGIGGSYDVSSAPLGSVHVACAEVFPEYGVQAQDGLAEARKLGFSQAEVRGGRVWDRIELEPAVQAKALGLCLDKSWTESAFATLSTVSAEADRAAALVKRFDVHLENMEGFSFALGCVRSGIPFFEIRTVSNRAGSRQSADWRIEEAFAALGGACGFLLRECESVQHEASCNE